MYCGFHEKSANVGDPDSTSHCKEESEGTSRERLKEKTGKNNGKLLKGQERRMRSPWEGKKCIGQDILSPLFVL